MIVLRPVTISGFIFTLHETIAHHSTIFFLSVLFHGMNFYFSHWGIYGSGGVMGRVGIN